jgi:hypothetical protein
MHSPFPGMDPYLESTALWPDFQRQLVACCLQQLRFLSSRYVCQVRQRGDSQDYLEVRQISDEKLITVLYVLGPADKTTNAGRQAYLDHRRQGRESGSNLVEVDLLLQGTPPLEYSREGLPKWDYAVTVTRAVQPERYEIYTASLQKPRLPRFRLPLAADDRDTVLDLYGAFCACYAEGRFFERIDYSQEPAVPLSEEDRHWIDALLNGKKFRLPHDEVAMAAYYIWQQEGRPEGRAKEHWRKALEQLRAAQKGDEPA